jgi:hypothetical protein
LVRRHLPSGVGRHQAARRRDQVLNTGAMSRVVSRSLDGLVTMLRHCNLSEHEALKYLGWSDCDLSRSYAYVYVLV